MLIILQRTLTSLVHALAGRTEVKALRRSQAAQVFEVLYGSCSVSYCDQNLTLIFQDHEIKESLL